MDVANCCGMEIAADPKKPPEETRDKGGTADMMLDLAEPTTLNCTSLFSLQQVEGRRMTEESWGDRTFLTRARISYSWPRPVKKGVLEEYEGKAKRWLEDRGDVLE